MSNSPTVSAVISALESKFNFVREASIDTAPVRFDAVLRSKDPMPIIVIEHIADRKPSTFKEHSRKIESFLWNLYRLGKGNMVTTVFIVPKASEEKELSSLTKRLAGIARVFLIRDESRPSDILEVLRPLSIPSFAEIDRSNLKSAALLEDAHKALSELERNSSLARWARSGTSADEMKSAISNEFEQLLEELGNALN